MVNTSARDAINLADDMGITLMFRMNTDSSSDLDSEQVLRVAPVFHACLQALSEDRRTKANLRLKTIRVSDAGVAGTTVHMASDVDIRFELNGGFITAQECFDSIITKTSAFNNR